MRQIIAGKIIHKGLIGEGQTTPLCSKPTSHEDAAAPNETRCILSEWLHDEITCAACLSELGIEEEVSLGKVLRDNLEVRLSMAFQMVDMNYYNQVVRKPGEEKVNGDKDGSMAAEFLRLTKEFDDLMRPIISMIEKHENTFGWPSVIGKG